MKKKQTPNIFSYATSELSQDAFFACLIKWSDDSYLDIDNEMCLLGKSFLSLLTGLQKEVIHKIDVGRQWCNIDVWTEINEDEFLIIEDKTRTSIHDDQLNRYRKTVEDKYRDKRQKLFYTYVKTENEPLSVEKEIRAMGYKTINRQDLLALLNTYKGSHPLVIDYRLHLQEMEDATNNYKKLPVDKWGWFEWQGFYKELEKYICVENWSYVPIGDFLGLWWYFVENDEIRMYLQFEESRLCFKIECEEENRSEIRDKYYNILMNVSKEMDVKIERPQRFGFGTYMTIGVAPVEDVFCSKLINMEKLIEKLKIYEQIVNHCMSNI